MGSGRWYWKGVGGTKWRHPSWSHWASPLCTPGTRQCPSGGPRTTTIPSAGWMTTGVEIARTPAIPACTRSGCTTCTRSWSTTSSAWPATLPILSPPESSLHRVLPAFETSCRASHCPHQYGWLKSGIMALGFEVPCCCYLFRLRATLSVEGLTGLCSS